MNKKYKAAFFGVLAVGSLAALAFYLHSANIAILNPKGPVAQDERNLLVFTALLSLIVIVPVYTMLAVFSWRYREGNAKAKYSPDWDHNRVAEIVWWGVPSVLITILSVLAFQSSHRLDPFKPLPSKNSPMTIQVVALQWKWLFIYPGQNIASVNYVQFPAGTPVAFEITADAPMNSFWIPQLGGQIYAMSGMSTQMHLLAYQPGSFRGSSANISGKGFAGMKFTAKATTKADFAKWVNNIKETSPALTLAEYGSLSEPSQNTPPAYYSSSESGLYDRVVARYAPFAHAHAEHTQ